MGRKILSLCLILSVLYQGGCRYGGMRVSAERTPMGAESGNGETVAAALDGAAVVSADKMTGRVVDSPPAGDEVRGEVVVVPKKWNKWVWAAAGIFVIGVVVTAISLAASDDGGGGAPTPADKEPIDEVITPVPET